MCYTGTMVSQPITTNRGVDLIQRGKTRQRFGMTCQAPHAFFHERHFEIVSSTVPAVMLFPR